MENQLIKFNVGGKLFTTTKFTLKRYPESLLAELSEDKNLNSFKDKNGFIFIDSNGDYFGSILNFYRYCTVTLTNKMTIQGLFDEAKFFKIKELIEILKLKIDKIEISQINKLKFKETIFNETTKKITKKNDTDVFSGPPMCEFDHIFS